MQVSEAVHEISLRECVEPCWLEHRNRYDQLEGADGFVLVKLHEETRTVFSFRVAAQAVDLRGIVKL